MTDQMVAEDLDLRLLGQPVLRRCADPVEEINPPLVGLVDRMTRVMDRERAHAVAAPQLGTSRRLFVWHDDGGNHVALNPEIVESDGEWYCKEGCLSLPGIEFGVVRPRRVLMRYADLKNDAYEIEATDLPARIFQHEIDHLDGVLVLDRCGRQQRKDALRTLEKRGLRP